MALGQSYRRSEIVSGAFVLAAAALLAWFAFRAGGVSPLSFLQARPVECVAQFTDVQGLMVGAPVWAAGRKVGEVRSIRLVEAPMTDAQRRRRAELLDAGASPPPAGALTAAVEVHFLLRDATLRLDPATARVRVGQDGLLGESILLLDPGYWTRSAPPLIRQAVQQPLALQAENPAGINEAIAELAPAIRRVRSVLGKIDDRIATVENFDALSQTIVSARNFVQGLERFVQEDEGALYARIVQPLNALLRNADDSITTLRTRLLDTTLKEAEQFLQDGRALVAEARDATASARGAIDDASPRVQALLEDADAAAKTLQSRIDDVARQAQALLTQTHTTVASAQPDLLESLRRLRRTMWEAELAMRKIRANPAVLLFGDNDRLLDAPPLDAQGLRTTGRARPYQQRDENDEGP
ncbi:MAG: MCE family protein [Planctomycetota bacterium]|nr:MAG: MCE family protein [Planctomycetota bacterium]